MLVDYAPDQPDLTGEFDPETGHYTLEGDIAIYLEAYGTLAGDVGCATHLRDIVATTGETRNGTMIGEPVELIGESSATATLVDDDYYSDDMWTTVGGFLAGTACNELGQDYLGIPIDRGEGTLEIELWLEEPVHEHQRADDPPYPSP